MAVRKVTYWKMRDESEYQTRSPLSGGDALANADRDYVVSPLPSGLIVLITVPFNDPNIIFVPSGL